MSLAATGGYQWNTNLVDCTANMREIVDAVEFKPFDLCSG